MKLLWKSWDYGLLSLLAFMNLSKLQIWLMTSFSPGIFHCYKKAFKINHLVCTVWQNFKNNNKNTKKKTNQKLHLDPWQSENKNCPELDSTNLLTLKNGLLIYYFFDFSSSSLKSFLLPVQKAKWNKTKIFPPPQKRRQGHETRGDQLWFGRNVLSGFCCFEAV